MDIRLCNLREHEDNLDDLFPHLIRNFATSCHHVKQSGRQWIQQTLPYEHSTEVILCCRALEFEDASDAIQSINDKLALLCVVLI